MCPNSCLDTWEESCWPEGPPAATRQRILLAGIGMYGIMSPTTVGHIGKILLARRASRRNAATDSSGWYWDVWYHVSNYRWTHRKNPVDPKGFPPQRGNEFFRQVLDVWWYITLRLDLWKESTRVKGPVCPGLIAYERSFFEALAHMIAS